MRASAFSLRLSACGHQSFGLQLRWGCVGTNLRGVARRSHAHVLRDGRFQDRRPGCCSGHVAGKNEFYLEKGSVPGVNALFRTHIAQFGAWEMGSPGEWPGPSLCPTNPVVRWVQ